MRTETLMRLEMLKLLKALEVIVKIETEAGSVDVFIVIPKAERHVHPFFLIMCCEYQLNKVANLVCAEGAREGGGGGEEEADPFNLGGLDEDGALAKPIRKEHKRESNGFPEEEKPRIKQEARDRDAERRRAKEKDRDRWALYHIT
jgi:hypothetical protein